MDTETERARANVVLSGLDSYCVDHPEWCGHVIPTPGFYPNVQDPEVDRRWITDQKQYVRSLGWVAKWDPFTQRYVVERGNLPIFGAGPENDPP